MSAPRTRLFPRKRTFRAATISWNGTCRVGSYYLYVNYTNAIVTRRPTQNTTIADLVDTLRSARDPGPVWVVRHAKPWKDNRPESWTVRVTRRMRGPFEPGVQKNLQDALDLMFSVASMYDSQRR